MDRSPPTHWQGASFENALHAPQQQQPTRALYPPTRRHSIASYQPALPSESRMPDEWGYPSSNIPRNIRGAAAPTVPTCRYLNCHRPVTRDEKTHELTEYCSPEHMRDAVQRLGYPVCPACNRCPRRSDSMFCGSLCDEWAIQQQRQQQHQQQLQSQQRQQQEHYQGHQQQRQHWQSPTMGPSPMVPNPSAVNAARGTLFPKNGIWKQVRFQQ